jgi:hypothetical protein
MGASEACGARSTGSDATASLGPDEMLAARVAVRARSVSRRDGGRRAGMSRTGSERRAPAGFASRGGAGPVRTAIVPSSEAAMAATCRSQCGRCLTSHLRREVLHLPDVRCVRADLDAALDGCYPSRPMTATRSQPGVSPQRDVRVSCDTRADRRSLSGRPGAPFAAARVQPLKAAAQQISDLCARARWKGTAGARLRRLAASSSGGRGHCVRGFPHPVEQRLHFERLTATLAPRSCRGIGRERGRAVYLLLSRTKKNS